MMIIMENLWKGVILAEEVVKFLVQHDCVIEYVKLCLQNSPMKLHHYRDYINY